MKVTWHGQSCVKIVTEEGTALLIDPFITGNPMSDLDPDTVDCDYILLTHGHSDHVGDTEALAARTGALIIANVEIANYMAAKGLRSHGMQPGGGHEFPFGHVKLTPAIHGSAYSIDGKPFTLGLACGILLQLEGRTIYHAGDTALFSDMKLIGEDAPIDLAFLPIGDNYTMGPKDAAKANTFLNAKSVVPVHYNTFPLIRQNAADFVSLLTVGRGIVARPGEEIIF